MALPIRLLSIPRVDRGTGSRKRTTMHCKRRSPLLYMNLNAHTSTPPTRVARVQGQEEIAAGALLLKERAKALAAGRKEDNWKGQLRDLFKLFDVEQRGALDEDQLAMLLKVGVLLLWGPPSILCSGNSTGTTPAPCRNVHVHELRLCSIRLLKHYQESRRYTKP